MACDVSPVAMFIYKITAMTETIYGTMYIKSSQGRLEGHFHFHPLLLYPPFHATNDQ